jgi:vacuolar protein 8
MTTSATSASLAVSTALAASQSGKLKRMAANATEQDIGMLVHELQVGSSDARLSAAKMLGAVLASSVPSAAALLVRLGAVAPLVALVSTGTDQGRTAAASCLAAIAASKREHQEAVARAGAMAPLVALLRAGSNKAQLQAAAALSALSEHAALRPPEMAAGMAAMAPRCMAPLVRLLKAGTADAQVCAALAIANLAADSREGQDRAADEGAVPLLVGLLASGKVQMASAGALTQLAAGNDRVRALVARADGLAPLLALLNGVNVPAQVQAAAALAELARGDTVAQTAISRAGGGTLT